MKAREWTQVSWLPEPLGTAWPVTDGTAIYVCQLLGTLPGSGQPVHFALHQVRLMERMAL